MFKTKGEIKQWLYDMEIEHYIIHDDLTVDVNDSVDLSTENLNEIPVQFGVIDGNFSVFGNNLYSLKGCPKTVIGNFDCSHNKLKTLQYCPKEILGSIIFNANDITSLKYCPEVVNEKFRCGLNPIKNLNGFTTKIGISFEHKAENLESCISELEHFYKKINWRMASFFSLDLSNKELEIIRTQKELTLEMNPSDSLKIKKKTKL